jgi:Xaa-Pro aminopeptidase
MYSNEIQIKLQRLGQWLSQNNLDGVLLTTRANFAWITGGRDNHIPSASESGVASILATPDKLICLTNHIESPRFRTEELVGTDIEVVDFPWWNGQEAHETVAEVIAGRRIASDTGSFGLPSLPGGFTQLRWSLTDLEIQRYRYCGQLAAASLESVCRQVQVGDTEFDIAARMEFECQRTGANPCVVLVSTDRRVFEYRHPIPTSRKLEKYAMLVICAEYRGLIANCTRFVHFGPLSDELKQKQRAVCNVDTAVNLATKVGRGLNEIFTDLQAAYAENGYPDEWKLHHQGGSTGYAGREMMGTPFAQAKVLPNQAFAWNPSIAGTKCEDTILATENGIEFITSPGDNWPKVMGKCAAGELARADILVR